jgi:hypothetical protein
MQNLYAPIPKFEFESPLLFFTDFIENADAQPPIELVDIYELLCHLMNIKPQPNDGIWDRIKNLLRNSAW